MARRHASEARLPANIRRAVDDFTRLAPRVAAKRAWRPIDIPEAGPFGVLWFGDPHVDDEACNWPQLVADVELCRTTPGLYGASVGDASNNWVGRLARLYAEQNAGKREARRRVRWLLRDAGVPWLMWLLGNHDEWNEGDTILDLMSDGRVPLFAWEARLELRAAGQRWRVHCAHDFPGHSMWNITHGPARAARMGSLAELFVCGHRHDWGVQSFEIAGHDRVVHAVRARGYKWDDHHALVNGFQQSSNGASMLTVFNPAAQTATGRVLTFADPVAGAAVLRALRAAPQPRRAPSRRRVAPPSRPSPAPRRRRTATRSAA